MRVGGTITERRSSEKDVPQCQVPHVLEICERNLSWPILMKCPTTQMLIFWVYMPCNILRHVNLEDKHKNLHCGSLKRPSTCLEGLRKNMKTSVSHTHTHTANTAPENIWVQGRLEMW